MSSPHKRTGGHMGLGVHRQKRDVAVDPQDGHVAACENCVVEAGLASDGWCPTPPYCVHALERKRFELVGWDEV